MTTATLKRKHKRIGRGLEFTLSGTKKANLNKEKGIIYDVKILGWESKNIASRYIKGLDKNVYGEAIDKPYRYDSSFAPNVSKAYENMYVFSDHDIKLNPETGEILPSGPRKNDEALGKLRGVYTKEDGIYAKEFHYMKSHPLASRLEEDIERETNIFQLSQNTTFYGIGLEGGRITITDWKPSTVDLVTNGATNSTLFEQTQPKRKGGKKQSIKRIYQGEEAILIEQDNTYAMLQTKNGIRIVEMMDTQALGDASYQPVNETTNEGEGFMLFKEKLIEQLNNCNTMEEAKAKMSEAFGLDVEKSEKVEKELETTKTSMEQLQGENKSLKAQCVLMESGRWTDNDEQNKTRLNAMINMKDEKEQRVLVESWLPANGKPDMSSNSNESKQVSKEYAEKYLKEVLV